MDAHSARRGLLVYLILVGVASAGLEGAILRAGGDIDSHPGLVIALMWTPALAMLVTRLVRREGFRDVSFAIRGPRVLRMLAMVWLYPIAVGLAAYGLAWATQLEGFRPPQGEPGRLAQLSPALRLAVSVGLNATVGTLLSAITATGEELGWRGYLVPRLVQAGVRRPLLVSGGIWAVWHLPLILSGQYAAGPYPLLSAACFVVSVIAAAYVVGRARLESGSVWPPVAFHAAWNAIIQGSFDRFTVGGNAAHGATVWTGEGGILVALVSALAALGLMARAWPVRLRPREEALRDLDLRSA